MQKKEKKKVWWKFGLQAGASCKPPVDSAFVYLLTANDKKMK